MKKNKVTKKIIDGVVTEWLPERDGVVKVLVYPHKNNKFWDIEVFRGIDLDTLKPERATINVPATGSITPKQIREVVKALLIAYEIATIIDIGKEL